MENQKHRSETETISHNQPPTRGYAWFIVPAATAVVGVLIGVLGTYFTAQSTANVEKQHKPAAIAVTLNPATTRATVAVDGLPPQTVSQQSPLARFDGVVKGLHQISVNVEFGDRQIYVVDIAGGEHHYYNLSTAERNASSAQITALPRDAKSLVNLQTTPSAMVQSAGGDCCWVYLGRYTNRMGVLVSESADVPITTEGRMPAAGDYYTLKTPLSLRRKVSQFRWLRTEVEFIGFAGVVPAETIVRVEETHEVGPSYTVAIYGRVSAFGPITSMP